MLTQWLKKAREYAAIFAALEREPKVRALVATADGIERIKTVFHLREHKADGISRTGRPPDRTKRQTNNPQYYGLPSH